MSVVVISEFKLNTNTLSFELMRPISSRKLPRLTGHL